MIMIKQNDFQYNDEENKTINRIKEDVMSQLEKYGEAYVYASGLWRAESFHKIVGKEFANAKYYVAYDYIPKGYRNLIVSKKPIGSPTGLLVSRAYE